MKSESKALLDSQTSTAEVLVFLTFEEKCDKFICMSSSEKQFKM
mgnify:CR=1 FL=1